MEHSFDKTSIDRLRGGEKQKGSLASELGLSYLLMVDRWTGHTRGMKAVCPPPRSSASSTALVRGETVPVYLSVVDCHALSLRSWPSAKPNRRRDSSPRSRDIRRTCGARSRTQASSLRGSSPPTGSSTVPRWSQP